LAIAKAWMDAGNYANAKNAWAVVGKTTPEMAPIAGLGEAKCLMLENKPGEAVTILQALVNSASAPYTPSINRLIAEAAEQDGNLQVAITAYQALLTSAPQEASFFEFKIKELKAKL